jgi:hypothetical protein
METPTKLCSCLPSLLKLRLIPFCFSVVAVQVQGAEREVLLSVLLTQLARHKTVDPNSSSDTATDSPTVRRCGSFVFLLSPVTLCR